MIYTVTLNPAIDKTAEISGFSVGEVNRVQTLREDAGGKGVNVSKCLKALGAESVAAVILAGEAGNHLEQLMNNEGLAVLAVQTMGQTRTNLKIADPLLGQNTDINEAGPEVGTDTLEKLLNELCRRLCAGDIVILSGSLPKGAPLDTYRRWTERFCQLGAQVVLDADGPCMAEGALAAPCLVKPNEAELSRLLGRPMETEEVLLAGGRELLSKGISCVVISRGGDGALFLWQDAIYRAESLPVTVRSTVGAGDSMVAAMAYGMERKVTRERQIALAMAMGAASVMRSGTQTPDVKTVMELSEQVKIQKLQ